MSRPTFVCVPGGSHSPLIFDRVKTLLSFHGYDVQTIPLPSNSWGPAIYDFTEDVRAIRDFVHQIVESGKDVIVVLHSYAGIPGAEALWGLAKSEREQRGFRTGVVRLVFIMSIMAKEGFQSSQRGDVSAMYPWMLCDLETGKMTVDPKAAKEILYNDLPEAEAQYWISQLLPQSIGVYWSRTTYAAWRYIPSTYVICGRDQTITPQYAEMVLRAARESRPNMVDLVERCEEGGYCVMLSQPQWTVDMLRRAAGERMA